MKYSGLIVLLVVVTIPMVSANSPRCLRPNSLQHGGWQATTHDFSVSTLVTFYCLHGYNLVGSQRAVCAVDGLHAYWVGQTPICVPHG